LETPKYYIRLGGSDGDQKYLTLGSGIRERRQQRFPSALPAEGIGNGLCSLALPERNGLRDFPFAVNEVEK